MTLIYDYTGVETNFDKKKFFDPLIGGLGVRLRSFLSPISFLGRVEKCLPSFANTNLSHLFEEGVPDRRRWSALVGSGSRLGAEFTMAWNTLKGEAVQCCAFAEEELPEIFQPSVEGFGAGAEAVGEQGDDTGGHPEQSLEPVP